MRILIISTFDRSGGAAIAASRLMDALNKAGIETKMLVRGKQSNDSRIISINTSFFVILLNKIRFIWERFIIFIYNKWSKKKLFTVSIANTGSNLAKHREVEEADIIHLHWVNQGFLSIKDIYKLIQTGKPVVWTMHDMWACTGICHHARECDHFTNECGKCFFLKSKGENDLSRKVFMKKKKLIFSASLTMIACSNWLAENARMSNLCGKQTVYSIPNPIDITLFDVSDQLVSRKKLSLPLDKKIILFGAVNLTDKRKGIDYLIEALDYLKTRQSDLDNQLCLVVFGQAKEEFKELIKIPVYSMGYLNDVKDIISLYNAVDLFVTSSLEENLPNTIMEAMACGTPCVGFRTGGIPEMIDHKKNGYVAEYKNPDDLAKGIHWVLNADSDLLAENARKKVLEVYREETVAKQYIELYKTLLR